MRLQGDQKRRSILASVVTPKPIFQIKLSSSELPFLVLTTLVTAKFPKRAGVLGGGVKIPMDA